MTRHLLSAATAGLLLVSAPAQAQFADDTQSLFSDTHSADQYETDQDNLVIWEFSTAPDDEEFDASAQSVEDICCSLSQAEQATQAICIDVDFTCY